MRIISPNGGEVVPTGRDNVVTFEAVDDKSVTTVDFWISRNGYAGPWELIDTDQPCLVEGSIRHAAEPVLLLAHESREALLAARVVLDEVRAEPVFDPLASGRALKEIRIEKGAIERGFDRAHLIVEGEYRTGHQEHVYIEPNGVLAVPEDGGLTVYGSIQCPYYVHRALCTLLGMPGDRVRVVQTDTCGGFCGNE